jgi:hypothetical protein
VEIAEKMKKAKNQGLSICKGAINEKKYNGRLAGRIHQFSKL